MLGDSATQRLPQHVLEAIVGYLPISRPVVKPAQPFPPPPQMQFGLLPFMHACQSWRHVGCATFYRSVFLRVHAENYGIDRWPNILEMHHAASLSQQCRVKETHTYVNIFTFNTPWDSDTPNVASAIGAYGQLPSVRSIRLDFGDNYKRADADEDYDSQLIVRNITTFVLSIRSVVSRACRITMDVPNPYGHSDMEKFFYEELAGCADLLIDKRAVSLSPSIIGVMPLTLPLPLLRELTLIPRLGEEVVDLTQKCAGTLERLHILRMTTRSALELTTRRVHEGHETFVYPRLKHFYLGCGDEVAHPFQPQPLVDPFPQLETLIWKGTFPFSTPVVLADGQSHLRHLDIDIDDESFRILDDQQLFAPDAFAKLHYISVSWIGDRSSHASKRALLYRSLELFQAAHVMRLHYMEIGDIVRPKALLRSMEHLQVLDLERVSLTLCQQAEILTACPCLQKANIDIEGTEPCQTEDGKLDTAIIMKYRQNYGSRTASVRYIGSRSKSDFRGYNHATLVVLLVDILGGVSRVCARPSRSTYASRFFEGIERNIAMPIYNDRPHVHECQFLASDDW